MPDGRLVTVTFNPAVDRVLEAPGFKVGSRVTGRIVAWHPAGRGIAISRVLATLGVRSIVTGFVGARELGMFEDHLERVGEGRIVCQLLIVRARTRDNISVVDPVHETETHLRDEGFEVQPEDVKRLASKIGMLAREQATVCFAGSLPPGMAVADLRVMAQRSLAQKARLVIDMADEPLMALRDLPIWLLKLNRRQLGLLAGSEIRELPDMLAAGRRLLAASGGTSECVIITRGADGAVLLTDELELTGRVSVHPGRIVSTVGSGESLLGGVLAGHFKSHDWTRALHEGLAAATANAVDREAGRISLSDVQEFREMTTVEPAPRG